MKFITVALILFLIAPNTDAAPPGDLLTVAEKSDFTQTATHAEVMELARRLAVHGEHIHLTSMGTSFDGKDLPLLIVSNPPVRTPSEAHASGKPIVFAFGNIHAGEVCGKEAILMLARELALDTDHAWFDDLILLFAPIYNADGNDRMGPDNRRNQDGPDTMGERPNSQGYDLNRDYIKVEAPETRAMIALLNTWDPHLVIDTHTTNGSKHRYTLTYDAATNPAGHTESIEFVRDQMLPAITETLRERTGYESFFYGNLNRDQIVWGTYGAQPRFGGPYHGLRGTMTILSEAYSYAPYRDRVICTREFLRDIFDYTAAHGDEMRAIHQRARDAVIAKGTSLQPDDVVSIRHRLAAHNSPVLFKGYELIEGDDDRRRPSVSDTPADFMVLHRGRFEPTLSVRRPAAYIVTPDAAATVSELLTIHGIEWEPFEGDANVEVYTVDTINRSERQFQGHHEVRLECTATRATRTFPAGSIRVSTAQPLGTLAVFVLEPESEDGFATWNFFDPWLAEGGEFPVCRERPSG